MKRALIVLLLLAVAGGLFAQVSFSGHVQSGIGVSIPGEGDTTFHWWSRDAGSGYRFDLGASYTADSGQAGASATIRKNQNADWFAIDGARAWVDPIAGLRLQAGTGGPGGFGSLGSFGEGNGAADVSGLNIKYTGSGFALGAGIAPNGLEFGKARYTAGVTFGVPSVLNAAANISYNGNDEVTNAAVGFGVTALNAASGQSGLTRLAVDVLANNLSDLGWIGIGPAVGFRVAGVGAGDLGATLQGRIYMPLKDTFDMDYWVGLDLGIPLATGVSANINAGFEGKGVIPGTAGAMSGADGGGTGRSITGGTDPAFIVRPTVTFNIGGGTLETGLSLQALLADSVSMYNAIWAMFRVGF
jgi:hypothetical protein